MLEDGERISDNCRVIGSGQHPDRCGLDNPLPSCAQLRVNHTGGSGRGDDDDVVAAAP